MCCSRYCDADDTRQLSRWIAKIKLRANSTSALHDRACHHHLNHGTHSDSWTYSIVYCAIVVHSCNAYVDLAYSPSNQLKQNLLTSIPQHLCRSCAMIGRYASKDARTTAHPCTLPHHAPAPFEHLNKPASAPARPNLSIAKHHHNPSFHQDRPDFPNATGHAKLWTPILAILKRVIDRN